MENQQAMKAPFDYRAYVQSEGGKRDIKQAIAILTDVCHGLAAQCGWWTDLETGESTATAEGDKPKINVPEKLMLVVSELGEGMEAHRKNRNDDHLPQYKGLPVELGDAEIRIFDLVGGLGMLHTFAAAFADKLAYNASRADHKIENRKQEGGKAY